MKREHIDKSPIVIPEPYIWFPFTSNATDSEGVIGTLNGSCSGYSNDGAYFIGSGGLYKTNLNILASNLNTLSLQIKFDNIVPTDVTTILQIVKSGNVNGLNMYHAPSWGQDLNLACYTTGSTIIGTLSLTSVPFIAGEWYTLTIRQSFSVPKTELWVNGVKRNTFNTTYSQSFVFNGIYVGKNTSSVRVFKGHIKNLRMWNVELTDEQIAAL